MLVRPIASSTPSETNSNSSTLKSGGNTSQSSTSNCKMLVRPIASSTPSQTNSNSSTLKSGGNTSQSENLSILQNVQLTPKNCHESTFGNLQSYNEETSETPSKRTKMDITLQNDRSLKVQLDIGITVAGGSVDVIPNSQEKLQSTQIMFNVNSPGPSKTKLTPVHASSSTLNRIQTKNKSNSPIIPSTKKVANGTTKQLKGRSLKPETENKRLDMTKLELFKKIFQEVLENHNKKELLTTPDIEIVTEFLKMNENHQYLLMNLFLCPTWRHMRKFCMEINLDQKLSRVQITEMYEYQKNKGFVDTDLAHLNIDELLELLLPKDLRLVAIDLKIEKKRAKAKAKLIDYLKQQCRTQSTLTMRKSSEDVLKDTALKYLGDRIKLKEDIKSTFDKFYVLQTCSNFSYCMDIQNFWKDAFNDKVVYPKVLNVCNYIPFENKEQYSRFYEAILMHKELEHLLKNKANVAVKNLCDEAFRKLQSVDDDGKWKKYDPDYIQKFSGEYLYISLLDKAIIKLTKVHFEDVKVWLEFLIERYPKNRKTGFWVKQLAYIKLHHYKNYESAAEIVIEALTFNQKENIFDKIQMYQLNKIANQIRTIKTYQVCALYRDRLDTLSEIPVEADYFQKKRIDLCKDKIGLRRKSTYSYEDSNNEVTLGSIENIVLIYYLDSDQFKGINCGGKFIEILFTLFFWDIIYEYYVPLTFISEFQVAPLDIYGDSFYKNRITEIDLRLEEIAYEWSEDKFEKFLRDKWNNHSHEKSITDFEGLDKQVDEILRMCCCIDRKVLSKIFSRLVINYEVYRTGFPDFFFWNAELSKYKFVMIQKSNKLQPNEYVWMKHLTDIGADVEVCHVSESAKKKTEDGQMEKHP